MKLTHFVKINKKLKNNKQNNYLFQGATNRLHPCNYTILSFFHANNYTDDRS